MVLAHRINLVVTLAGLLLFGALFAWVQVAPGDLAGRAADAVVARVADDARARLTEMAAGGDGGLVAGAAARAAAAALARAEAAEGGLRDRLVPWVRDVAEGCDACVVPDVPPVARPLVARAEPWVRERVSQRSEGLVRSLAIFAGTNALLFAAALLIGMVKGRAAKHLLLVSALMVGTIALASWWFVTGQDWAMSVLMGDFVGWAYAAYVGVVLLFLIDVAVLHGAITGTIIDAITAPLSAVPPIGPC
ncbi:hypothetical protein JQC91_05390 [Jannaschia sp. Os4]|uniref:hypothetical protein n=1 Tax=Jannaschia sp. Os4 TaxID=2807617 RepID=UPI00193A00C1|nr:hypothetical protein [Jannaschia sp. Os4]MBM2575733.1 hypothetical protein [Jannaschia sp. Os4]